MNTAVMTAAGRISVVVLGCNVCFGTGRYWAKPGVLLPCPNGCQGFTAASTLPVSPRSASGCLVCGCTPAACGSAAGCGCTCCCSYLPAVAKSLEGTR